MLTVYQSRRTVRSMVSVTLTVPRERISNYVKENFNVQQPSHGMYSQLTFMNQKQ